MVIALYSCIFPMGNIVFTMAKLFWQEFLYIRFSGTDGLKKIRQIRNTSVSFDSVYTNDDKITLRATA